MKYLISDIRSLKWVCQNIQYGSDVYNQNTKNNGHYLVFFLYIRSGVEGGLLT